MEEPEKGKPGNGKPEWSSLYCLSNPNHFTSPVPWSLFNDSKSKFVHRYILKRSFLRLQHVTQSITRQGPEVGTHQSVEGTVTVRTGEPGLKPRIYYFLSSPGLTCFPDVTCQGQWMLPLLSSGDVPRKWKQRLRREQGMLVAKL